MVAIIIVIIPIKTTGNLLVTTAHGIIAILITTVTSIVVTLTQVGFPFSLCNNPTIIYRQSNLTFNLLLVEFWQCLQILPF